jgi:lipoyl(octanoyl) transferase
VDHATLIIRHLASQPYETMWQAMREFTEQRDADTPDELWLLEHHPVYTQGRAGKPEHVLNRGDIPIVHSDRGGQVTYHGPGQLIGYCLIDIQRKKLGVRELVTGIEQSIIHYLASLQIAGHTVSGAPGVYVEQAKIAALGLRIHKGCSYHGFSINVDMDLEPFSRINPCGMNGLKVTQLSALGISATPDQVAMQLIPYFAKQFHYSVGAPVSV